MSYTAPPGNAVNFAFDGASYTAPAGDAVHLSFTPDEITISGLGAIALLGEVTFAHGTVVVSSGTVSLSGSALFPDLWHGAVQIGGVVSLVANAPLNANGAIALSGVMAIRLNRPLYCSGVLRIGGEATFTRGGHLVVSGKIKLGGGSYLRAGRTLNAAGSVRLQHGAAQLRCGENLTVSDGIALLGGARFSHVGAVGLRAAGQITVLGAAQFAIKRDECWPSISVFTAPKRMEVFSYGV